MTERWMVRLALTATLMLGSFLASAAEGRHQAGRQRPR